MSSSIPSDKGCWRPDYIFSYIAKFREHPERVLPDRSLVSMTFPLMRAYTELLVRTCHRRRRTRAVHRSRHLG